MKAYRTRNIFDRSSNKPFKISRSKFENFLKCERCFYLDRVMGVNFPSSPPFTLNNLVDDLLKKEFDSHREAQTAHPLFETISFKGVPYQHDDIEKWRDSLRSGVQYLDEKNNLILSGGVDDVWLDQSNNSIVVVDYKATSKTGGIPEDILEQPFYGAYKTQLDFYSWLFKRNGFEVANYGYFMFCNGIKTKKDFGATMDFEYKFIKYNPRTDWIDEKIDELKKCLMREDIPQINDDCENCTYSKTVSKVYIND